ncbi:MAG: phosphotransferase [Dehalococcoidales bacterium]|jgi:aminoglycoside phosphotransferase family enzyme
MSELPELVQSLLEPGAYPEPPPRVELVQTQISYVFLAGDYVYKIKKPVDMGFLDYTTLEKRLYFCRKEVELNRRLCADAYLGVEPITEENGRYRVGGKGRAEEYAVKMRRLPQDAMMDVLLQQDKVTPAMVAGVADILVKFHQKAATSAEITRLGGIEAVIQNTSENFTQTDKYFDVIIAPEIYRHIKSYTEDFLKVNAGLFHKRMAEGRVRDCHGDLHAAHICFYQGICIYDCIEFIDRLRYTDVAADIAFLAMDLDYYGRRDLSDHFIGAYVKKSGDQELLKLLNFYKCYRAYVRGKIGCLAYDDPYISAGEKAKIVTNARSYFELAESYTG